MFVDAVILLGYFFLHLFSCSLKDFDPLSRSWELENRNENDYIFAF